MSFLFPFLNKGFATDYFKHMVLYSGEIPVFVIVSLKFKRE